MSCVIAYFRKGPKAAIGYTYEDSTPMPEPESDSESSVGSDIETMDIGMY